MSRQWLRWRPTNMPAIWCWHGESGWTARMVPLTVDGLIYASSMVMLDSARRKTPVPALARWLLGLGIAATLAANVAHGLGHGLIGAMVAAWPAVALVGSYELLMMVIRSSQGSIKDTPQAGHDADPLLERAAELFAGHLAADRFPRCARSALNSTSASLVHNDYVTSSRHYPGVTLTISPSSRRGASVSRLGQDRT